MSKNKKIKIKENAENTVFLMYNLLQYSGNYFLTSWKYHIEETDDTNGNAWREIINVKNNKENTSKTRCRWLW